MFQKLLFFVPLLILGSIGFIRVYADEFEARTLVVFDKLSDKSLYSQFFQQLEGRGHKLSFVAAEDNTKELVTYGEYHFENLVLFAPRAKSINSIETRDILKFIEHGGNVLASSGTMVPLYLRKLSSQCGVKYHSAGTLVMDHYNFVDDSKDVYHSVIKANKVINSPVMVGSELGSSKEIDPILFKGVGQTLDKDNILTASLLRPHSTAYSASPAKSVSDIHSSSGMDVSLVSAVQGRNNARIVFSGSLDLFSDEFFKNKKVTSSNLKFTKAISEWVFGETGILRVTNVRHRRADGSKPSKMLSEPNRPDQPITLYPDAEVARESLVYRIKDNLTYSFDIQERFQGKWQPFQATDMQLEFVMLDAYVRKTITHNGKGHFSVTFTSPDVYGIYKFRVMYRRLGYSTVELSTQVSLRPYKHNEYERFIVAAYPYYASAFSMMAGVFVFGIFFLYSGSQ